MTVSPSAGPVGTKITIEGHGFPANANLSLNWATTNVSWIISGNPRQVTDIKAVSVQVKLASVRSSASGSFSVQVTVPLDFGGKHFIQAANESGSLLAGQGLFTVEPSFHIAPTSGPAGTPITVTATGLGDGLYSTNYHVMWDNKDFGYMTAVTTHGATNTTFYAVGDAGVHYVDIYQGYPGAAYLNPQENPSPGNWFPPLLPYHAQFVIASGQSSEAFDNSGAMAIVSLGLVVAAFAAVPLFALQKPGSRRGIARTVELVLIIAALVLAGVTVYFVYAPSPNAGQTSYAPQVVVVRPQISVPQTAATTGPRISVAPNLATVGAIVNVTGSGFAPNTQLPISWSSRQGNNLNGFKVVNHALRNVTTDSGGSFSFGMKVPHDLEGAHFISASNLTPNSNATLYIERSATISSASGPEGSKIVIKMTGVGWDYITNIAVVDYDNSYVGYGCGFNSQGNVTMTLYAAGSPGIHTIDIYPSIWLGPQSPATIAIYRYALLTPQDHPELSPSFHFSYLITQSANGSATQSQGLGGELTSPLAMSLGSMTLAGLFLLVRVVLPRMADSKSPRWVGGFA